MTDCNIDIRQFGKPGRFNFPAHLRFDMQRVLAAAAGLFAASIALPAASADLAAIPFTKESAAAAVIYDWSGLYTGINGGGGSVHSCWEVVSVLGIAAPTPISEGCHNAAGGTAGGQIGYRWQTSRWVFGLEAQGNWADFNASNVSLVLAPLTNRSRIGAFGLFTGQVGYTANNLLFYMKGGAAVAQAKYDTYVPAGPFTFNSVSETRWGGALGVGLEFGFAQNWSVAAEYDHVFLGHHNASFATPAGLLAHTDRIGQDIDMGLVRVNYRWGGPVVAKY